MKFKENEILYYVYPFPTINNMIEKVMVSIAVNEMDSIYYIDQTGAYLKEEDLHYTFEEAKKDAFNKLNRFYSMCSHNLIAIKEENIQMEEF